MPVSDLPGFVEDYWLEPSLKKKPRVTKDYREDQRRYEDVGESNSDCGTDEGVYSMRDESSFSIEIRHPEFKFNASHFIAISDGTGFREKLHGHNYTVVVKMKGSSPPLANGYLVDFGEVKKVVKTICKEEFNERFICPMLSAALSIASTSVPSLTTSQFAEQIQITCEDGSFFSFPKGDVVCLPIRHSSVEELARYMWCEIIK
jgi:6-pyruvoyl-tetrahydropterin synthase